MAVKLLPGDLSCCCSDFFESGSHGQIDEQGGGDIAIWYLDNDGDTFGDASEQIAACGQPQGYVTNDLDCNDSETGGNIHPNASEVCDDIDNNCDEEIDNDPAMIQLGFWIAMAMVLGM